MPKPKSQVEIKKRMADFAPPPQKAIEDRRDERWKVRILQSTETDL